jgi:excisionase family DNA binding protein
MRRGLFYAPGTINEDFRANCVGYAIFFADVGKHGRIPDDFRGCGADQVHGGTLRKFVLKRRIAFYKWGRVLRFRRSEIELWMKSGATEVVYLPDGGNGEPEAAEKNGGASAGGETCRPSAADSLEVRA